MWCSICYRHLLFCPVSGYLPLKAGLHANVHVNTTKQKDTASGCRCKHSATSIQPFTEYINRFAFLNPGKRMGTEHAFTTTWAKLKPVQKICFPTFFFSFSLFFFLKRTASTSSRRHCVLRIALIKSLGRMWPILACEESYRCHSITVTSAASSPLDRACSYLFTAFQLGLRWNKESLNHAHCAKQPIRAHPKGALKSCYVSSHILPY